MKVSNSIVPESGEAVKVIRLDRGWPAHMRLAFCLLLILSAAASAVTRAPTPPLKQRVADSDLVFVGKVVNRERTGDWVKAELLVEEPLKNVEKGDRIPVTWRLVFIVTRGRPLRRDGKPVVSKTEPVGRPLFDKAEGARGIAILGDKHEGRYWLRADKFGPLEKLETVRKLTASTGTAGSEPEKKTGKAAPAAGAVNDLAIDMYRELAKTTDGENVFFSPYSISTALGMTYAGARGTTAEQMQEALSFRGELQEMVKSFGSLQDRLNAIQKDGDIKLEIANAIWAEQSYQFLSRFLDLVENQYKAKLVQADFAENAEAERRKINAWVEDKTNDKIKNLIPEGVLDSLTRMVLVNAIYFKGDWASQFDTARTGERDFLVSPDEKVKVPMMYQQGKFRLAQTADVQALELPYQGDKLSMLVLLPKQKDGLDKLEESLNQEKLNQLVSGLRETTVQVSFPKFKVETGYNLVPPLQALGMKDAFSRKADFSGMDGSRNLYISAVLHKAFVEVDEQGTEAAAATAVVVKTRSAVRYPRFNVDHPFLFLIRDNATGSILFMGRITDPTAGQN